MSYKHVEIDRRGHIAIVTLKKPERLNALTFDFMKEIEAAATEFRDDTETRVVIFTGEGKHFCAGRDLGDPTMAKTEEEALLIRQREFSIGPRMIRALTEIDQITIAAINGGALGGGACITTALDFRIGASDCFVAYPEAGLGIPLSWISLPLCVHLVGPSRAKRLIILSQKESAETLLDWGFLDKIVPGDTLMKRALEMAGEYAALPPISAQMVKRSVNAISSALDQAVMHMDTDQVLLAHFTKDFKEGVHAFFEKREPEFKGE